MGIDVYALDFLLRSKGNGLGDTLWLGRQGFHMPRQESPEPNSQALQDLARQVLRQHSPDITFSEICGDTGYGEALFKYLGTTSLRVMDNSNYEGADLLHDLNIPVSSELHNKFDCIFDGGTIEHIFNIPMVFENVQYMLRIGGLFLSATVANNFLGHGFYQFSPELMWRVFSQSAGYRIEHMYLVDAAGFPAPLHLTDPAALGHRIEIGLTASRTYLMVAARKITEKRSSVAIQQSDYTTAWSSPISPVQGKRKASRSVMTHDVSIVTAFFDIGRGDWQGEAGGRPIPGWLARSNENYLGCFDNLARLRNQIVVFTEQKFADAILDIRKRHGLEAITSIMVCDNLLGPNGRLADNVGLLRTRMRQEFHEFVRDAGCPEYWNADYVMLNALKTIFVCTTTDLRLNAHEQIAWIDFGYCRDDRRFDPTVPWRFDCGGQMNLFYIRKPDDRPIFEIVRTGDVYFQGCHIVGPADCWFRFSQLIDEAMASLLACGLVDDDQTALLMAYRRAPELFRIHAVDPADWFVIFRKFRKQDVETGPTCKC